MGSVKPKRADCSTPKGISDGQVMHTMGEAENAFRMIVVKKDITPILPGLDAYLSQETKEQHHTVKTIRYKLYHIAGKVISHSRQITLKVNEQFVQLLQEIRKKAYEMSLE